MIERWLILPVNSFNQTMHPFWKKIFGVTFFLLGGLSSGFGLWLLFSPAEYEATARIKVENGGFDFYFFESHSTTLKGGWYDSYFIPMTFEIIRSDLILSNAAIKLNKPKPAVSSDGVVLKTVERVKTIREHLSLKLVRGTKLIAITFRSPNPKEAAEVANAIAEAYSDYRIWTRNEVVREGLVVLQEQFQKENLEIQAAKTNLLALAKGLGVELQIHSSTNHPAGQEPYWRAAKKLEQYLELHRLLTVKIQEEEADSQIPKHSMVQLVDRAQPPSRAAGPNRWLGIGLLAAGLISCLGGRRLLKTGQPSSGD